jgi:hypothetical protein
MDSKSIDDKSQASNAYDPVAFSSEQNHKFFIEIIGCKSSSRNRSSS